MKQRSRAAELGTPLVVQWLRLRAPNAGNKGLIPGWGTSSHMLQLSVLQIKNPHATTKIKDSKYGN